VVIEPIACDIALKTELCIHIKYVEKFGVQIPSLVIDRKVMDLSPYFTLCNTQTIDILCFYFHQKAAFIHRERNYMFRLGQLFFIFIQSFEVNGAHGSVVGSGTKLQARRSRLLFPMRSWYIFNWPKLSSRTMTLGSIQPLIDMSTRNFLAGKGRPTRKAHSIPSSINRLSMKCESLDVSQLYGLPWPVTGIDLPFTFTFKENYGNTDLQ
jgi:hypothetical protein